MTRNFTVNVWQRYEDLLDVESTNVTLGEGLTPLVASQRIGADLGLERLHFKLESHNPTGSYKDRFIALEVALALESGQRMCIATSSGNTGSSLAAYAARYSIGCHLFVNEHTPAGKLQQMLAHGAKVYRIRGFGVSATETLETFNQLRLLAEKRNYRFVVSAFRYSPAGMQGVKTVAYEIVDQVDLPDHLFVPVGGGGLLTAVWRGFKDSLKAKPASNPPAVHAVQPSGCPTVVNALLTKSDQIKPVDATTQISGLAVPFDIDGSLALAAVRESKGRGFVVTDDEVWEAQEMLCRREGIYVEPAGATSLAGLIRSLKQGWIKSHESIVCLLTGHGFKDPTSIARMNLDDSIPMIEMGDISDLKLTGISS